MNKKLLLVLLISVLMLFCFAWVYARHVDETEGTTTSVKQPSKEDLQKLREVARKIKPEMQAAPEVRLEDMPGLPHVGEVNRPTMHQTQLMMRQKGLSFTDPVEQIEHLKSIAEPVPAILGDYRSETFCVNYVHDEASCCWYQTGGQEELWGWEYFYDGIIFKVWQDPQDNPGRSNCGYPIYPFKVSGVYTQVWHPAPCSMLVAFDIQDFYWDHCTPYPGEVIWQSEPFWYAHGGGWGYPEIDFDTLAVPPEICMYDRYFASFKFLNTMEFDPNTYCYEDPPSGPGLDTCIYDIVCVEPPLEGYDTCIVSEICVEPPLEGYDTCIIAIDTTCLPGPGDDPCIISIDTLQMGYWDCVEGIGPDSCVFSTKDVFGHWVCEDSCEEPVIEGLEECLVRTDTTWGHWECIWDPDSFDVCLAETTWGHYEYDTTFGHLETTYGHLDTTWGYEDYNRDPSVKYFWRGSMVFDQGGMCGRAYWSYGGLWEIGYFWDAVCDLPAFGMGYPGAVRVRAYGYTADQNDCVDPDTFFWQKEAFDEYAPCGIPDFDQKFKEELEPEIGPFDGPTAAANCLWWMVSAGQLEPFWAVQEGCPRPDCWMHPDNVPFLINELADFMGLGDCGVTPAQLDSGLEELKNEKLLFFTHEEVLAPSWEEIEYNCRISQDVLLLLGFWYIVDISEPYPDTIFGHMECLVDDPVVDFCFVDTTETGDTIWGNWFCVEPPIEEMETCIVEIVEKADTTWARIGGHWVTVAGVDAFHGLLKISDPDLDMAELGFYGEVCSNPRFIPHVPIPHPGLNDIHNDAGNTSHDIYPVAPSITPCGEIMLAEYPYDELDLNKYLGHNLPYPECEYVQAEMVPELPIYVEIEAAKILCPEEPYQGDYVESWDMTQYKTNYGAEGAGAEYAWVWWASPYGAFANLWEGSIILGTNAADLATALPQIGMVNFQPASYFNLYYPIEWTHVAYFDSTVGGDSAWAEFLSKKNTDLWVRMYAWGFVDKNYFYPQINQAVYQEFTITNKGTSAISDIMFAMFLDMDPFYDPDATLHPRGTGDSTLNTIGMFEATKPAHIDYLTLVPTYEGKFVPSACVEEQNTYLYPDVPGPYPALDSVMNLPYWKLNEGLDPPVFDWAELLVSEKFTLAPDEQNVETYIMWSDSTLLNGATNPARNTLYDHLKVMGFFRGDVNDNGDCDLADAIDIAAYKLLGGAVPTPFHCQGDVNLTKDGDCDLADAIDIAAYKLLGGASPTDYARFQFGAGYWQRISLFEDGDWKNIGK